jgi:hypothetical protein
VKILFLGRHYTYFRNFEGVLQQLAARGHALHLAVERSESFGGLKMVQALAGAHPNVTYGEAPTRPPEDDWAWTASQLRLGLDYLRYQHPVFDDAPTLRDRARDRTPAALVALGDVMPRLPFVRGALTSLLSKIERAVPPEPAVRAYIESHRPDVVLITPLVDLGSSQVDYLRTAKALAIPTAVCVWSWDHLSSKALIREQPDRVFVWNDTQKREAETLHGFPASRIVVTGAQCFDQWFDREPSRDRAAFCAATGLPISEPIVLWVCSALFAGSPVEAGLVRQWIRALRASGSALLRRCSILVRPHPSRLAEWEGLDLDDMGPVSVWGSNPIDAQSRADYFDSLYHCAAVVGLNTSAFIEAAIVGRPVHTIILPEFESNQTGTVHFSYLLNTGGGLLRVARDFEAHARQLDEALTTEMTPRVPFVREFVRPHGLAVAATPLFVRHVEQMASLAAEPARADALAGLWVRAARAVRFARTSPTWERWVYSAREAESLRQTRERIRQNREAEAERRARRQAELQQKHEEQARLKAEEQARLAARRAERERRRVEKQALLEQKHAERRAVAQARREAAEVERGRRVQEKQARLAAKRARVDAEREARKGTATTR